MEYSAMFLSPNLDIGMVCENTCMSAEAYFLVNFSLRIFLSICNIHNPPSPPPKNKNQKTQTQQSLTKKNPNTKIPNKPQTKLQDIC